MTDPAKPIPSAPGHASAGTLLVVDDEASVRQSLAAYLEDSGFTVLQAEDGDAGLAAVRAHQPELVLCDLRMPGLDGLGLLRQVHEDDPDLPVIVVSGAGSMDDVVDALRLGAADYLVKPIIDLQVLEYAVQRSLERARLQRENQAYKDKLETVNAQLSEHLKDLQKDQRAGRHVQLGMLPPTPMEIDDCRLAHTIFPSLFLSGDFIDYFRITDKHFIFYVADVSGHGASSAFVTVLLKNISRRLRREYRVKMLNHPELILEWLNREILDNRLDKHVTMFLGVVNTDKRTLRFANAGHFPFPVLATDEGSRTLEVKGKPLGLFPDPAYDSATVDLPEKFILGAFSDGVLEVMDGATLAEKEACLQDAVAGCGGRLQRLCAALHLEDDMEAPDDVACLLVTQGYDNDTG